MSTILFPTDFSDAATRAFIYALQLADRLDAKIITLHVFEKPDISGLIQVPHNLEEFYNSIDLYEFDNYKDAVPLLDKIQDEQGLNQLSVVHTLHEGDTEETILERAIAEKADFIVMGTTGARGLKEIILGSVAGEVLENASCPVLAIPEQAVFDGKIDNIAFTTAFQPQEKKGLGKVLQLFEAFSPQIHCVNVDLAHTEEYHHRMDVFSADFVENDNVAFHVLDGTDFQTVLTKFLEEMEIDVVAMVTEKRSFLEELFHYSKTKALSYHSRTPILSLPAASL
ncbi:MAG: universal stress protein [Lewinella sp.]|uniref:universal stress protein n=1 Tax=Lewinella sp. TaxID=2004506 RepID=UPI003D6B0249